LPILVGRPHIIHERIRELGLRIQLGQDVELMAPEDPRFQDYGGEYYQLMKRKGVSIERAKTVARTDATVVAALAVKRGDADAMLCGTVGSFDEHLQNIRDVIGKREGIHDLATLSALILPTGTFFICDSHINPDPNVEEIVEMTLLAAEEVQAFGLKPKVALLSRSNFGTYDTPSSLKMREAIQILQRRVPHLEVEGEMNADAALSEEIRNTVYPDSRLKGQANLLIMPNADAAHISLNLLKMLGGGVAVGPILVGAALPVHVVNHSITVRGLLNMSAMAVVQAHILAEEG
jgi:malate dehydrogenase (oxaloacetate-decarboxylating)(NADP+)